jgi:hypothetical protein
MKKKSLDLTNGDRSLRAIFFVTTVGYMTPLAQKSACRFVRIQVAVDMCTEPERRKRLYRLANIELQRFYRLYDSLK